MGTFLLTGIIQIILFVCPCHSGQFILEVKEGSWAYPPTVWALLSNKPGRAGPWGGAIGGWLSSPRGFAESTVSRGGLVAFVLSLSSSAASVTRITSHVSALKFADWEPHGAHQVPVISTQLALYFSTAETIHAPNINRAFACLSHLRLCRRSKAFKGFSSFFPTLFTPPLSHSFIKKVNYTHKKVLIAISLFDVWSFSFFVTFGIISKEPWQHIHSQKGYHWGSILMYI